MAVPQASLRLTRRYAARPAEVWAALTDPERLGRWLGPVRSGSFDVGEELELQVGGRTVPATVRVLDSERRLELDWRPPDEDASLVRIELSPHGDGTMLVLDHSRLEEPACMRWGALWTRSAGRLDELLEVVRP